MTALEQNIRRRNGDGDDLVRGDRFLLLPCVDQRWAIVDRDLSFGVVLFCPSRHEGEPILSALNKDLPSGTRRGSILIAEPRV